jgi:putative transposase
MAWRHATSPHWRVGWPIGRGRAGVRRRWPTRTGSWTSSSAIAERALHAGMDHYLVAEAAEGRGNSRKRYGRKVVLTDAGKLGVPLLTKLGPRDQLATVDPQLIAECRRPLPGFDEKIVSLSGLLAALPSAIGPIACRRPIVPPAHDGPGDPRPSRRDLRRRRLARAQRRGDRGHPRRGGGMVGERGPWPKAAQVPRTPLEILHPLVFVDALEVKIRDEGMVRTKASTSPRLSGSTARGRSSASGSNRQPPGPAGRASSGSG